MCIERQYKINLEAIEKDFRIAKGLTHSQGNRFKLLPYKANEKRLVDDFTGVVGAFSRNISNKELKGEFNSQQLIEEVSEKIGEYEGSNSKEVFKDIVSSLFIENEKLVNFDIRTINYISSTSGEEDIANFMYSLFFDDELLESVENHYERDVKNILYNLVLDSLPKLTEKEMVFEGYKCSLPFVKKLFIEDFKFLIEHEELYKESLKRFLEYYYMFYISQLVMKLGQFEKADLTKPEVIYYTLSWESTSKNRRAYKFGWELIKSKVNYLFTHAVTLELLNYHSMDEQFNYIEIYNLFDEIGQDIAKEEVEKIYELYTKNILDVNWDNFKCSEYNSGNQGFDQVVKLFNAVDYQFHNSARSRASEAYRNWYIKFVNENFSKRRGPLGYNLNITEEDIIFMTKLCIKDNQRLKLNLVFEEFESRGMFFDRDSKLRIIQLYEKLNILEKKSDSGDAQYVRSIL